MRFFFATVILLIVSFKGFSQQTQDILEKRVSLKLSNITIAIALEKIEEQAKVNFAYNSSKLQFNEKVNIQVQEKKLDDVLKRLLEGTGVTYFVVNNQIILKEAKEIKKEDSPHPTPVKKPVKATPKESTDQSEKKKHEPEKKSPDEVDPDTISTLHPGKVIKKKKTVSDTIGSSDWFIQTFFNEKDSSKFALGLYVSVDKSFYRLNYAKGSEKFQQFDFRIAGENNFEYTIGITPRYSFSKSLKLGSGIFYSQKRKVNVDYAVTRDTVNLPFPVPGINSESDSLQIFYEAKYLEIPFTIQLHYRLSSLNLYSSAGVVFNFNFPNKTDDFYYQATEFASAKITLSHFSSGLSLLLSQGIQLHLNEQYTFYAEPVFKYSLYPVTKQSEFRHMLVEHAYFSFSIAGGVFFNF